MNPIERFQTYLESLEKRLRAQAWLRGLAVLAVAALAGTAVGAWIADRLAFSDASLFWMRFVLFLLIALAVAFGIAVPLLRINRRRAAVEAEQKLPEFRQRLLTLTNADPTNPFSHLVAEEALSYADQLPPAAVVESKRLLGFSALGLAGICALLWLTLFAPGPLGHGASLLWAGVPRGATENWYRIEVKPGNAKVRKGSDQVIEAQLVGFDTSDVRLLVRQSGASRWESVKMEPKSGLSGGYGFVFAGLSGPMDYRVEAGRVKSTDYHLNVVSLPSVKKIKVTYRPPAWLGGGTQVEDPGGDLRAVEGTNAELEIETDQPLPRGLLMLDDGTRAELKAKDPRHLTAQVAIQKDGTYHIAALDAGEEVRISDDYFIEARKENPPEVRITRPGRDARVSPIEEVPIDVEASDDFGLTALELHYSVNGGPERVVPMLQGRGSREGKGSFLMALEDEKLQPGDVVALFGVARDARTIAQTEIAFIEAQPFEKEYSQSQSEGGGSGGEGGENQTKISQRQKEIISATWNEMRSRKTDAAQREDAAFLSGVQSKLSQQAQSLSQRMKSRTLAEVNDEFKNFSKEMDQASAAMKEAVDHLKVQRWKDSLPAEQRALQHVLRAEALFKQIQVAFGNKGGGGSGDQSRDLESLFDLELDTEKNQYETANRESSSEKERQIDEALKRLEELARRQQQLAEEQRRQNQQSFQQRWNQEMLRREAEELKRQMQQLAQSGQQQGGQQSSSQQGSSSSSSSSSSGQSGQQQGSQSRQQGQQGQSGGDQQQQQQKRSLSQMANGRTANDPRLQRALSEIERATEDMRRAQQSQGGGGEGSAERAAERMRQAQEMLGGMRQQQTGKTMDDLAARSRQLADHQRDFEQRLNSQLGNDAEGRGSSSSRAGGDESAKARRLAEEKDGMRRDLENLQRDMQSAVRSMTNSQREAATKLREALGESQQNELSLRMKFASEWLRSGMGGLIGSRERVVTQMTDQLNRQVEQARQVASGQAPGSPQGGGKTEQALNQLERARESLRQQLDQRRGQQPGQSGNRSGNQPGQAQGQQQNAQGKQLGQQGQGQQPGQGQQGQGRQQNGQPNGQQAQNGRPAGQPSQQQGLQGSGQSGEGNASGMGGQQRSGGMGRSDADGANDGSLAGPNGAAGNPRSLEQAYSDAVRQLEQLRSGNAVESADGRRELDDLLGRMRRLDPKRFPGNPQLLDTLEQSLLPQMERVEIEVRRKLEGDSSQARTTVAPKAPAGYEKAVADYFRRLSQSK